MGGGGVQITKTPSPDGGVGVVAPPEGTSPSQFASTSQKTERHDGQKHVRNCKSSRTRLRTPTTKFLLTECRPLHVITETTQRDFNAKRCANLHAHGNQSSHLECDNS